MRPHHSADPGLHQKFSEGLWRNFGLEAPVRWSLAEKGHETWILDLKDGTRLTLRRYPQFFQESWIQREHSILNYLKKHEFPVSAPVSARCGESFIQWEGRYYATFEYCYGEFIRRPWKRIISNQLNAAAGRTLAQLHRLMADFYPQHGGITQPPDYPWRSKKLTEYSRMVGQKESLTRYDRYYLQHAREAEDELGRLISKRESVSGSFSRTVLHGDFGPHNVFFGQGKIVGVIDFIGVHEGIRAEEVASATLLFSKWLGPHLHLGIGATLFRAYQEEYPLEAEALDLLPDLMRYWILESLRWVLMEHYVHRRPGIAHRFRDRLELARWIKRHEGQIKRIAG